MFGCRATGVEGLKTIPPEAAISNWYAYYRTGGLNLAGYWLAGRRREYSCKILFQPCKRIREEAHESIKEAYAKAQDEMIQAQDRATGNYDIVSGMSVII